MHFFGKLCAIFCRIMHQKSWFYAGIVQYYIAQFFWAKILNFSFSLQIFFGFTFTLSLLRGRFPIDE